MTTAEVVQRFPDAKVIGSGWEARCPAHEDRRASLSIAPSDDGKTLIHCHAGCSIEAICGHLGIRVSDLFNGTNGHATSKPRIVKTYDYENEAQELLCQVCRFVPKGFSQRRPDGTGHWVWGLSAGEYVRAQNGDWHKPKKEDPKDAPRKMFSEVRRVLYHYAELLKADPAAIVFIPEGEKDVENLEALGLVATCNPQGAGKWSKVDPKCLEAFRGRRVCIIVDKDTLGRKHVLQVARSIHGIASEVRIIELPGDGVKDASDWLQAGGTVEELLKLVEAAPVFDPADVQDDRRQEPTEARVNIAMMLTDVGNAEQMVKLFGNDLRYVPAWGKWLVWDGRRWTVDETGQIHQRAKATIRKMLADAGQVEDDAERRRLVRFALASESNSRLLAMVERAKSEPGIPVTLGQLNADDWLLNVENGTIDLRTGDLGEHRREDLITRLAPARYIEGAEHLLWFKLLHDATNGDTNLIAFLQRAVGYSLTGSTREEKLFFVHGPGAAGKSTFIEALKAALGDYAATADFETFIERGSSGPRNDIARLDGARFVSSVEVSDGRQLAQGLVKMLTGGDTISARFLYSEAFSFVPKFKLWLAANHAPRVDDQDDAMWRRIVRIPFERVIPKDQRDTTIKTTLRDDLDARAAVLAWAVAGCLTWQSVGLRVPESIEAATEAYRADQDPLREFFAERCIVEAGYRATSRQLRQAYVKYAEDMGVRYPLSQKALAERLRDRGCTVAHDRTGNYWAGIGLLEAEV